MTPLPPPPRPLSILHVLEKNAFGTGSVQQMFQAAVGAASRGHRVAVVSRPGEELEANCRRGGVDLVPLALRHEFDLPSAVRFARILREREVDVVHVHKGIAHSVALVASFLQPIPAFVVNRGVSFPIDAWMRPKFRPRRVHRVVTVCEDIRRVVIESGKLPPEKVAVVYAGTDLARFDPRRVDGSGIRRELGIPADAFLACQIGVREWRGWRDLVAAMKPLVEALPQAHLLLVACRDEAARREVMDEARRWGVERAVTAIGYRTDVPEISAALDVAVDLSWGGLGITGTLREAMAMERPVVASSAGGNPELVVDGTTGFVVPPRDPAATARALLALARDPGQRRAFGLAGRRRVEEGFSMEIRIDRLLALYAGILRENGRL